MGTMMKYLMMTMDTRTKVKKIKKLSKLLERLIAQDHLYSEERIEEMKEALSSVKEQIVEIEKQNYKGFGK